MDFAPTVTKFTKNQISYGGILGQGSFGVVQEGTLQNKKVAIKVSKQAIKNDAEKELNVMAQLSHPNVLKLIGVVDGTFPKNPELIFEYMKNGSLKDFLEKEGTSEDTLLSFMHDIACGMNYLHEMNFVHRDLAARNILIDDKCRAKVADFGLSRFIDTNDSNYYYKIQETSILPIRWVPKECVPIGVQSGRFTFASDVWSFGVTVWEIWAGGNIPYKIGRTNEQARTDILGGQSPLKYERPNCPKPVMDIMEEIFVVDPKKRPNFTQLKLKINEIRLHIKTAQTQVIIKKSMFEASKEQMELIRALRDRGSLKTNKVEQIMISVDRSNYVSAKPFMDKPQSIGCNVNISAPHMHAIMLEEVAGGLSVGGCGLDIGSGSGYITACMGRLVGSTGRIFGIDHMPELVEKSIINVENDNPELLKLGIVKFIVGDGRNGYAEGGPYDVIHVGAAADGIPKPLLDQLKEGGRLVIPIGPKAGHQELLTIVKRNGKLTKKTLMGVIFASLTSQADQLRG